VDYEVVLAALKDVRDRAAAHGLELSVIERYWPHDALVHGDDSERAATQMEATKAMLRAMGELGIGTFCYNWMANSDWTRTSIRVRERGGCLVSAYDASERSLALHGRLAPPGTTATARSVGGSENVAARGCPAGTRAVNGEAPASGRPASGRPASGPRGITPRTTLWRTLEAFLREVLPVAEAAGVALALHPDDPPVSVLGGQPQVCYSSEQLLKVVQLVPSPANGVCLCQGTLSSGGEDVPLAIRSLAPYVKFVHFRDVVGTVPRFRESWQDNGQTDMAACLREYRKAGILGNGGNGGENANAHGVGVGPVMGPVARPVPVPDGLGREGWAALENLRGVPFRPDHVPTLEGEDNSVAGYHMNGRLWALGFLRGLAVAVASESGSE
jgi:mannonate dehydratase